MILSQLEFIYFVNQKAERELYMIIESKEVDGLIDYSKGKGKVQDSALPAKYIGEQRWDEGKLYLKNKDIKINNRANLIVALDYYTSQLKDQ